MSRFAELRMQMPSGDFCAAWPKDAPLNLLVQASAIFNATMSVWIEEARGRVEKKSAGEIEYDSWSQKP